MQQEITFTLNKLDSALDLNPNDQELFARAQEATKLSYSPYSNFQVGAAAKLSNGEVLIGSNQENASYGATICAERVLLSTLSTLAPKEHITTLAIGYYSVNGENNKPLSPCGICRQALLEHQMRHKQKLRVIMGSQTGEIWLVEDFTSLLPLAFSSNNLS